MDGPNLSREDSFCDTHGHYELTVMPFEPCNATATFQRLMESVLAGLACDKCLVYLDNILVIGQSFEEHRAGLRLKPAKCKLLQREVEFLGHVVSERGISIDPKKVVAIADFPQPTDLTALRAFLGLTSYYQRLCRVSPQWFTLSMP